MRGFDFDRFDEVFVTLRSNKARAVMTACGVFWGIFMLVLMLGFGRGLEQGVGRNFGGLGADIVYLWGQRTQKAHAGWKPGRWVKFYTDDAELLRRELRGARELAPRIQLGGWQEGINVTYGEKTGNFGVMGDYPEYKSIEPLDGLRGRFINPLDIEQRRKVTVIGQRVANVLFGDATALGRYIKIRGVYFRVVGVFASERPGEGGERANSTLHIPFTTFQVAFNAQDRVGWIAIEAASGVSSVDVEQEARRLLIEKQQIHPDDAQAIGSYNAGKQAERVRNLFTGVRFFIWFVSVTTLLAGVLGVSNIMLISVRERTKEFGVRKALGATPASVVILVLQESALLTTLAGYVGLVCGVLVLETTERSLAGGSGPLSEPRIDVGVAVAAMGILAAAGVLAGIMPARKAAAIRPVEALRAE